MTADANFCIRESKLILSSFHSHKNVILTFYLTIKDVVARYFIINRFIGWQTTTDWLLLG
jgi:hypothetical protein